MKILHELVIKDLKLNRKRTLGTVVAIILASALLCGVITVAVSARESLISNNIQYGGNYHLSLAIDEGDIETIEANRDVKAVFYRYKLGMAPYINSRDEEETIILLSYEAEDPAAIGYKIIDGRWAKNDNEIVISENLTKVYELGQKITLNYGDYGSLDDANEERDLKAETFEIVGVMDNSMHNIVITTGHINDNIEVFLRFNDPWHYRESLNELLGMEFDPDNYYLNEDEGRYTVEMLNKDLLRLEVFDFSYVYLQLIISSALAVSAIIVLAGVICIRNSFMISLSDKIKTYGILKSVGATNKQIGQMVKYEGLILGVFGIPLGLILGNLGALVILLITRELLKGRFDIVFQVSVSGLIVAAVLAALTIALSLRKAAKVAAKTSPIANILQNGEKLSARTLKIPRFIEPIFKTGGVIAYKNLKRNRRRYRSTVISITISVLLFLGMSSFVYEVTRDVKSNMGTDRYNVSLYDIPDEETLTEIKKLDGIEEIYVGRELSGRRIVVEAERMTADYLEDMDNYVRTDYSIDLLADDEYDAYCKELNIDPDTVKDGVILFDKNAGAKRNTDLKIGDKLNVIDGDANIVDSYEITYIADIGCGDKVGLHYNIAFYLPSDKYNRDDYYTSVFIKAEDPDAFIGEVEKIDDMIRYYNDAEYNRQQMAMVYAVDLFMYSFLTVITLIAVTNLFNTITNNVNNQQREYAVLKSVGMTRREFGRMINLEVLFYGVKSLFIGIVLGIAASVCFWQIFNYSGTHAYVLPIGNIVLAVIFVFLILFIIMRYSISRIERQNIIETIRNDSV